MASLRFVIVLLIALGAAVPALAHSDYCDACLTLAEELFTEVDARVRAAQKENRGGGPVHVEGAQIVAELCTSERMQPYKDSIKAGCGRIVTQYFNEVLGAVTGQHSVQRGKQLSEVLVMKDKICSDMGICSAASVEDPHTNIERNDCDSCRALASDLDFEVRRMQRSTDETVRAVVENLCERIPMRHAHSAQLADYCFDFVEEQENNMVGIVRLRRALTNRGFQPTQTLVEKLCDDVAKACEVQGKEEL